MNKIALGFMLSMFAAVASAQAPAPVEDPADDVVIVADATDKADAADAKDNDRNCIRDTGTRLKHRDKNGCVAVTGRSYSREDLDSTGAADIGDALRRLDPSISGGR